MILENNMSEKQVKVKVVDCWRVVFDGTVGLKGDALTVPESVADEGERCGYVERVTGKG